MLSSKEKNCETLLSPTTVVHVWNDNKYCKRIYRLNIAHKYYRGFPMVVKKTKS